MVILHDNETIDHALRRFRSETGAKLDAYNARRFYRTRSEQKRAKAITASRRRARRS